MLPDLQEPIGKNPVLRSMRQRLVCFGPAVLGLILLGGAAFAQGKPEKAECLEPRFSDVGWTDITITTEMTSKILSALGYKPQVKVLGTDITYLSMKNGDIDIFLGTWLPGLQTVSALPYYADGSIQKVRTNLTGAKFTLAVPKYVSDAGVLDFKDLDKHKNKFGGTIFGLEPGGNKPIEEMISKDAFGLADWTLGGIERSGNAISGEKGHPAKGVDRISSMGAASHEHNVRHNLSGGWRRLLRQGLRRRDR